ncbi:MAG: hypothetical protein ACFFCS_24645 [Candidatus Hodarchaeota archaeon]
MRKNVNIIMLWAFRIYNLIWFFAATNSMIGYGTLIQLESFLLVACFGSTLISFIFKINPKKMVKKASQRKNVNILINALNLSLFTSLCLSIIFSDSVVLFPETIFFIPVNFFFLPEVLAFLIILTNIELSTVDIVKTVRISRKSPQDQKVETPPLVKLA